MKSIGSTILGALGTMFKGFDSNVMTSQIVEAIKEQFPKDSYKAVGYGIWFKREREMRTQVQSAWLIMRAEAKRNRKNAKRLRDMDNAVWGRKSFA